MTQFSNGLLKLLNDSDEPVVAIAGRFVQNTLLTREQIFDEKKGIIHDKASLPSAPSAHFVLILNNHRLIYFPETAHAPNLSAFRSTALHFLRRKHKAFIDTRYEELRDREEKVTKKALYAENPAPALEIIPISGEEEIEDFLKRYKVLKKIEFRLVTPNDEIDGEELFGDIREYFGALHPDNMKIETRNSKGLDIEQALPTIQAATATANQEVKLSGIDKDGNDLKGDNHEFQIGAPVETIPATRRGLTRKLFSIFENLNQSGVIQTGEQPPTVADKIRSLLRLL